MLGRNGCGEEVEQKGGSVEGQGRRQRKAVGGTHSSDMPAVIYMIEGMIEMMIQHQGESCLRAKKFIRAVSSLPVSDREKVGKEISLVTHSYF
jgi:hypothetical protein